jgi:hypothetical protein
MPVVIRLISDHYYAVAKEHHRLTTFRLIRSVLRWSEGFLQRKSINQSSVTTRISPQAHLRKRVQL